MSLIFIPLLWIFNYGVSWLNAYSTGLAWQDAKATGVWARVCVWAGAIMAASGFTWCYSILFAGVLFATHVLTSQQFEAVIELGYVTVIFPVLGSGLVITVHSWIKAARERNFANTGIAVYNTFADVYNMANAFNDLPRIFNSLGSFFSSDSDDDEDNPAALLVVLIVLFALALGVVQTGWIISGAANDAKVQFNSKYAGLKS